MLNQETHRKIMFEILRDIYRSDLGFYLGFKGGTMLYFFYNLERFSVDLDFDLLDDTKEELVSKKIEKILKPYGKIDDIWNKNFTIFALLNYEDGMQNIKIEISKRKTFTNKYEFKNLYGTDIQCMDIKDSFAHKLIATTSRRSAVNRDFYDLYFFWKNGFQFNEKIIEKIMKKNANEYLKELKIFIEKNLNENNVLHGIGELVSSEQKIWIKKNLKQELLNYIDFNLK